MELLGIREPSEGGFNFENCLRNHKLIQNGFMPPKATKTGTTIAGVVYSDGVILGADTRATMDAIITEKNCTKIHYLRKNIYCCGAGTAADTDAITSLAASQMELHCLNTGREAQVISFCRILQQRLYRYSGDISAALILGGVDCNGPHLISIDPDGSVDAMPFLSMGSGSLAAMSVLEKGWEPRMSLMDAKILMKNAITAGMLNDLGSGCFMDICTINKDETTFERNIYKIPSEDHVIQYHNMNNGSTFTLLTTIEEIDEPNMDEAMDYM